MAKIRFKQKNLEEKTLSEINLKRRNPVFLTFGKVSKKVQGGGGGQTGFGQSLN